jgi:hypothetical protein
MADEDLDGLAQYASIPMGGFGRQPLLSVRPMAEEERQARVVGPGRMLLQGGVTLSEWATFLAKDTDLAFVSGACIAS